jgi:hypothetical protein
MKEKMMRPVHAASVLCAALALAATHAVAQAPDADLPLARATAAAILAGSGEGPKVELFLIAPPADRFDTLTAVELLAQAPGRQDPESDYALYIGTRGARIAGDTAMVIVLTRQHTRGTGLNWWENMEELRFVRDGDGWRFVQRLFLGAADGGDVRGFVDRPAAVVAQRSTER